MVASYRTLRWQATCAKKQSVNKCKAIAANAYSSAQQSIGYYRQRKCHYSSRCSKYCLSLLLSLPLSYTQSHMLSLSVSLSATYSGNRSVLKVVLLNVTSLNTRVHMQPSRHTQHLVGPSNLLCSKSAARRNKDSVTALDLRGTLPP